MNSRLISIIRKEFIQIFRDKRTLALILVIPLLELFLLGYAATNDVRNVPMAVFDQSRGPEARALLDAYRAADYFKLNYFVNSNAEMQALIQNGSAKAGLIIPPDYAAQLNKGSAQVAFILDGSDPTVATTALSAAQLIGQDHATGLMVSKFSRAGQGSSVHPPVEVRTTVWYNPDMNSSYFMIPGLIGLILTAIIGIVTATSVVRERERGTIEQLIVTPHPRLGTGGWEDPALYRPGIVGCDGYCRRGSLVVWRASEWFAWVDIYPYLGLPALHPGHRVVCIHSCQHPARSHVDCFYDHPAEYLYFRFYLPAGRHACGVAVDQLPHPTALFLDDYPGPDGERRGARKHPAGCDRHVHFWRGDHGRGRAAL